MVTGAVLGFVYDLFRLKRKVIRTKSFLISLEDIIFWVFSALLLFTAAYFSNDGEVRLYFFFAALLGVLIYYWIFSRWVIQILTFLVKMVIWPFAFLISVLKVPLKKLLICIRKGKDKAGRQLHLAQKRLNCRFKSIRHIIRKM